MTTQQLEKGYELQKELRDLNKYLTDLRNAKEIQLQESSANELRFAYPKTNNSLYLSLSANRHIHEILVQEMPCFLEGLEKRVVDRIAVLEKEFEKL